MASKPMLINKIENFNIIKQIRVLKMDIIINSDFDHII